MAKSHARPQRVTLTSGPVISTRTRPFLTQALDVVLTKETVDPLLIRVWWTDVGRVAGDCSYDDTRWGCKNDPTMGKKDNPNPRLRKADIRTGQRWHLNDSGDGDTEYSLHRDWPDM